MVLEKTDCCTVEVPIQDAFGSESLQHPRYTMSSVANDGRTLARGTQDSASSGQGTRSPERNHANAANDTTPRCDCRDRNGRNSAVYLATGFMAVFRRKGVPSCHRRNNMVRPARRRIFCSSLSTAGLLRTMFSLSMLLACCIINNVCLWYQCNTNTSPVLSEHLSSPLCKLQHLMQLSSRCSVSPARSHSVRVFEQSRPSSSITNILLSRGFGSRDLSPIIGVRAFHVEIMIASPWRSVVRRNILRQAFAVYQLEFLSSVKI